MVRLLVATHIESVRLLLFTNLFKCSLYNKNAFKAEASKYHMDVEVAQIMLDLDKRFQGNHKVKHSTYRYSK